ncbi:MAG: histidinol phosphate phosphatase domain-containing protein [Thermodesulfobacteria bacterium]|nr:histidinol phosphate phosphatase domain-containing protein [Thermodesulfobacteriota bacterium]
MFDLHCHSVFSDGELIPAEIIQRVRVLNYEAIAITDHADHSNFEFIINNLLKIKKAYQGSLPKLIVGVEITHVNPDLIPEVIKEARKAGAELVVVHGETIAEPVAEGTNLSAILGGADILAHPGLIKEEEVKLAGEKGVFLEISARKGHCLTNGHVVKLAKKYNVSLVINSDAHSPSDLMSKEHALKVGIGAGLTEEEVFKLWEVARKRFL